MDHIDKVLKTVSTSHGLNKALRACADVLSQVINKYYDLTDTASAYRTAMDTCNAALTLI
jgi:hypothetical protein